MDHFGIGAALKGAANFFFLAARETGRTTALLESLKHGDRVIFAHPKHAQRFQLLLRDHLLSRMSVKEAVAIEIECITVDARGDVLHSLKPALGRTIFDHVWVEHFYMRELERADEYIAHFQRKLSTDPDARRSQLMAKLHQRWDEVPRSGL